MGGGMDGWVRRSQATAEKKVVPVVPWRLPRWERWGQGGSKGAFPFTVTGNWYFSLSLDVDF